MTVQFKDGRGTLPLWGLITLIVTVVIAAGSIAFAAQAKASSADHTAIVQKVDDQQLRITAADVRDADKENRLRSVEGVVIQLKADTDYIKKAVERIERKLDR